MSAFLSFFAMTFAINPHFTKGIAWTVDQKAFTYGQNLTLFCKISNCCFYTAGWDRWKGKERTPIYIDVRNLKDDSGDKYGGKANKSGIFLTIRDLKEVDLNTEYSCSYDFNVSKKKLIQKTDAFQDLKWIVDQRVSSYGHDLTLFCNVGICCEYQTRWSTWTSVLTSSPEYVKEENDINEKYNKKVNNSGFFLTIRNLREDDLNKEYACLYNYRPGKRQKLLKSDAFYKESAINSTPRIEKEEKKESSGWYLVILTGVAVLMVVILSCFVFLLIHKRGFQQYAPRNQVVLVEQRHSGVPLATEPPGLTDQRTLQDHRNAKTYQVLYYAEPMTPMNLPKLEHHFVLLGNNNAETTYPAPLPNSPSSVLGHNTSSVSATQPLLEEDNNNMKDPDCIVIHATRSYNEEPN